MKSALFAVAAGALLGNAAAGSVHDRHQGFHNRRSVPQLEARNEKGEVCGCTTFVSTITGPATLSTNPASSPLPATSSAAGLTSAPAPPAPSSPAEEKPMPTPAVSTYTAPGTYTIPAETVTLTESTTVCAATTASLTPGVNTYGGVTTSVVTATTVTCPYAAVETTDSTTTSVIKTTTYTCPAAGEYTIAPTTTSVPEATVTVHPTPTSYAPGTYTHPEQTVTITKTNDVFVCPYSSQGATPTPTPTPTGDIQGETSTPAPAPAESTPVTPVSSAGSTPAGSTPTATGSAGSGGNNSNGMTTNGNQWAITYTPYSSDGQCQKADDVMKDVKAIKDKGFTTVRVYATDCDGLINIGAACAKYEMKMIIGVYIDDGGIEKAKEQVTEITKWGAQGSNWDLVELIVVGNEAIFNQWCTAAELGQFIMSVKTSISEAGLAVKKLTTTETLDVLQEQANEHLCQAIDVIGVNAQPFFNADCVAEKAGDFILDQLKLAKKVCPDYPNLTEVYNLEAGWPHKSSTNNNAAIAGTDEQAKAIKSIIEKAGTNTVLFSYGDDSWKSAGEFGVEGFFGCADQIELLSGELKIGGLSIDVSLGSDGLDLDIDWN